MPRITNIIAPKNNGCVVIIVKIGIAFSKINSSLIQLDGN